MRIYRPQTAKKYLVNDSISRRLSILPDLFDGQLRTFNNGTMLDPMDSLLQHVDIIVFGVCEGHLDLEDWLAHVDNINDLSRVRIAAVFCNSMV